MKGALPAGGSVELACVNAMPGIFDWMFPVFVMGVCWMSLSSM